MQRSIILLILFGVTNQFVLACKCDTKDDIKTHYTDTEVIIHGKVLSEEYVTFSSTLKREGLELVSESYRNNTGKLDFLKKVWIVKTEIEIIESYKGNSFPKTIIVYTSRFSASCGYLNFKVGEEFQVYLSPTSYFDYRYKKTNLEAKDYIGYWTNMCTRTREFDIEEDKQLKSLMKN